MSLTLQDAITQFGVDVDEQHQREAEIPVLTGLQAQGDVIVVPAEGAVFTHDDAHLVPTNGIAVVEGENGGHTHLLLASGNVEWIPNPRAGQNTDDLVLGALSVATDATAYLAHPEHAYSGIGAGTYEIRRQREGAESARQFVAD
jgi:hypothetical protein